MQAVIAERYRQSETEGWSTSHDDLDKDAAVQEDVRNAARALVNAVGQLRRGELVQPDAGLHEPRQK